ncbi:hypothetical protein HQ45_05435 [Porphyromonas crevioricanis]|nr:hypothetical protein HQ45_05435 [Porphyromonas crevioricanis]
MRKMQSTETEGYAHYTYTARKAIKTSWLLNVHANRHLLLTIHPQSVRFIKTFVWLVFYFTFVIVIYIVCKAIETA